VCVCVCHVRLFNGAASTSNVTLRPQKWEDIYEWSVGEVLESDILTTLQDVIII